MFPVAVPPLRDRPEDIPLLVWRFVEEFSKAFGSRIESIDQDDIAALQQYSWPGNIRELRNVVERAMIVATGLRLTIPLPHAPARRTPRRSPKLADVEKDHIRARARDHGLADPRHRRRRRSARAQADDARDADGEARIETSRGAGSIVTGSGASGMPWILWGGAAVIRPLRLSFRQKC